MERQERNPVGTERPEATRPPQMEHKHPPEWQQDLNPDRLAGQNIGIPEEFPTAFELKELHRRLGDFTDDELKQIPVVRGGSRLHQGATYLDLRSPDLGEFTATGEMAAAEDARFVAKADVPYTLWNRLRGIENR